MAIEPDWFDVRVDGSVHRSFQVAAWPMLPVSADWRGPLLTVDGATPYDVVIGEGLGHLLPSIIGTPPRQVALIHPRALRATGEQVRADLATAGLEAHAIEVPDAEEAKKVAVAESVWSVLGRCNFTRSDVVVGSGPSGPLRQDRDRESGESDQGGELHPGGVADVAVHRAPRVPRQQPTGQDQRDRNHGQDHPIEQMLAVAQQPGTAERHAEHRHTSPPGDHRPRRKQPDGPEDSRRQRAGRVVGDHRPPRRQQRHQQQQGQ